MFRKLAGLTAVTGLFFAGSAWAGIADSAHDLSTYNFTSGGSIQEICVICHAPHNNQNADDALLWNRAANTTNYTAYSSPTLDGASGQPGATSLLCLGCHDGTVAVDSYGAGGGTQQDFIDGVGNAFGDVAAFSTDLRQDHPVGITYSPGTAPTGEDAELHATDNAVTFGVGSGTVATMLQAGKVECASCHDVHNTVSEGNPKLLNVTNVGSAICLACHDK